MSGLTITRWQTRYRTSRTLPSERVADWDAGVRELEQDPDVFSSSEEALICIRSLQLRSRLHLDDGSAQAKQIFREALGRALAEALRDESHDENLVRYAHRRAALADLLYRIAVGDTRRLWAWQQLRLLPAHCRPDDLPTLRTEAVLLLEGEADSIWPLLMHCLQGEAATGSFTALLRAFNEAQWQRLLRACPQTGSYLAASSRDATAGMLLPERPALSLLLNWIAANKALAARRQEIVAVLLAATAQPASSVLSASRAAVLLASAKRQLNGMLGDTVAQLAAPRRNRSPAGAAAAQASDQHEASSRPSPSHTQTAVELQPAAAPSPQDVPAPALPPQEDIEHSDNAGLVFLLNLLPATGLLQSDVLRDGAAPLPLLLHRLAVDQLQMPCMDAAVRAFCGGWRPAPGEDTTLDEPGRQLLGDIGEALKALLRLRLPSPGSDEQRLQFVCQRSAEIHCEPGWIELRMAARDAQPRIRRAALDLDPGWIPWLGCVMRFRYD